MTKNPQLRRAAIALVISGAINIVWLGLDALTDSQKYPYSRGAKIVSVLGAPGGTIADWFAPPGHDAAHFIGGALIAIMSSLLLYAVLAWTILSLLVWWRSRQ